MTSTRPETVIAPSTAADRAQTFIDWTKINARLLTVGAAVIAVAAAGYWFYLRSTQIQASNAERALLTAKQSMTAGNMPLAQKDLQNVYAKYGSTSAGVQAAMLLAQIDFDSGKYQDGISLLEKVAGSNAASGVESTVLSLEGDGYAQMKKLADAGKRYEDAAAATSLETEKAFQLAKAARAYSSGGDVSKAKAIWTRMLTDPSAQSMVSEARVRLGELEAAPAKR
jgi:predicted negative regulator of RcsB-dependent stress response